MMPAMWSSGWSRSGDRRESCRTPLSDTELLKALFFENAGILGEGSFSHLSANYFNQVTAFLYLPDGSPQRVGALN